MQADPIKPKLKAPGTKRLKLKSDELLANFALTCNLRRYDEERQKGEENRQHWAMKCGVSSDHISVVAAYSAWDKERQDDKYQFCKQNLLGAKTLQGMGGLKRQLLEAEACTRPLLGST